MKINVNTSEISLIKRTHTVYMDQDKCGQDAIENIQKQK